MSKLTFEEIKEIINSDVFEEHDHDPSQWMQEDVYSTVEEIESNELLLRIQPDAGIEFSMWAKKPGLEHQVGRHKLHFSFKEYYENLPEAYEQVIFNAINGDHNLFTSSEEVVETWRILDVVQQAFAKNKDDLVIYPKGNSAEEVLKM